MKTHPKVVVIILNWNGKEDTVNCLGSLSSIVYPNYEIVVVDNYSTDGSVECLEEIYPSIEIIRNNKNLGFAEGNNTGIRRALEKAAEYVLLLNNDTIVERHFLDYLVDGVENDQTIGFAGPKIYYLENGQKGWVISFAGGVLNPWIGRAYHRGLDEQDSGQYDETTVVDYVEGSCLLVRKDVISRTGLLDSIYFSYWEDIDWCIRGREKGYKSVFFPKAKIWHKVSASSTTRNKNYYFTRNRFWFMKKRATKLQRVTFLVYFLAFYAPLKCFSLVIHERGFVSFKFFLQAIADGLKTAPPN